MEIRLLQETDDRATFRSGGPELDGFFLKFAGQNQFRHHLGTSYVAIEDGCIIGYATVAAANLELDRLPATLRRRLPQYPLPVLRLARLAVDGSAQSRGIGKMLLRYVLELALKMAEMYGCVGVVVDAKPDASEFYGQFGFLPLAVEQGLLESRPLPIPMFLPLDLVRTVVAGR